MLGMSSPRKCLILAAGRGSRLASWGTAKPRLRLLGVPLIERVILTAQRAGLSEFTVVTGYDGPGLRKFLDELAVRRGLCIDTVVNELCFLVRMLDVSPACPGVPCPLC